MKKCIICNKPINPQSAKRCRSCWLKFAKGKNHPAYGKKMPSSAIRIGKKNPFWKGGKSLSPTGYMLIRINNKYVYEHRYIMEKHIKRKLKKGETIHHINRNKLDNRIENLKLYKSHSEHISNEQRKYFNCSIKSCNKPYCARGYCRHHYYIYITKGKKDSKLI